MNEEQFRELARKAGYHEDEIQFFVEFHAKTGIPYDVMPLMEHIVN
jgi:hypothetical protein